MIIYSIYLLYVITITSILTITIVYYYFYYYYYCVYIYRFILLYLLLEQGRLPVQSPKWRRHPKITCLTDSLVWNAQMGKVDRQSNSKYIGYIMITLLADLYIASKHTWHEATGLQRLPGVSCVDVSVIFHSIWPRNGPWRAVAGCYRCWSQHCAVHLCHWGCSWTGWWTTLASKLLLAQQMRQGVWETQ